MKISTKIAATVIALCSAATAAAAPATIRSSIDSTTMTMGNKTMIRVAVVKDKSQAGHLIAPQDSIVNEVEVAGEISHSVADLGNGRVQEKAAENPPYPRILSEKLTEIRNEVPKFLVGIGNCLIVVESFFLQLAAKDLGIRPVNNVIARLPVIANRKPVVILTHC